MQISLDYEIAVYDMGVNQSESIVSCYVPEMSIATGIMRIHMQMSSLVIHRLSDDVEIAAFTNIMNFSCLATLLF